jgi:hypothetical protein
MTQLVLTPEQANLISQTRGKIPVFLPDGSVAGYLSKGSVDSPERTVFTPEEIAKAQKAAESPGPWYTTQEVLDHLRTLDSA